MIRKIVAFSPIHCSYSAKGIPAATEAIICFSVCRVSPSMTSFMNHGLTARIIRSASLIASWLLQVVLICGLNSLIARSLPSDGFETVISTGRIRLPCAIPLAMAPPIFPAPIIATFMYLNFSSNMFFMKNVPIAMLQ
ncbi:hypothetical protein JCM15093_179 [Bacteroides graminisolvens DSM 19988 = JCM 15093]|uniref:Uncharacterized protein n=1 Tax=Bacteroides graminisolvens DSM 19988 = JCM 15093 TaxID=1121097 RepID=A0A069CX24_9BACE|nr:hypothetical protein JCM15093_179 [Bacteroides graminisolvens DSM 19988 = JCM 15093]